MARFAAKYRRCGGNSVNRVQKRSETARQQRALSELAEKRKARRTTPQNSRTLSKIAEMRRKTISNRGFPTYRRVQLELLLTFEITFQKIAVKRFWLQPCPGVLIFRTDLWSYDRGNVLIVRGGWSSPWRLPTQSLKCRDRSSACRVVCGLQHSVMGPVCSIQWVRASSQLRLQMTV